MSPEVQILLSGAITVGAPLAIALHELLASRRRPPPAPDDIPPEPPPPKPLPDCLRPNLHLHDRLHDRPKVQSRELEDA